MNRFALGGTTAPEQRAERTFSPRRRRVLLTGGAGYVGIHTAIAFAEAGYDVAIIDDLSNSHPDVPDRVAAITGRPRPKLFRCDLLDTDRVKDAFRELEVDAVVHLADLKSAPASSSQPLTYYGSNLQMTLSLLEAMRSRELDRLVFSSSAAVYGANAPMPVSEDARLAPATPYGQSKAMIERIIADICTAHAKFSAISLRYFNPVGAHPSGLAGERSKGGPQGLFPRLVDIALGGGTARVNGLDWPTRDGSCIRDFFHVCDLADGHVAAVERLLDGERGQLTGHSAINLGSGTGHSVLDAISAIGRTTGRPLRYEVAARRPGDISTSVAQVDKARDTLNWFAKRNLETMVADLWKWRCTQASTSAVFEPPPLAVSGYPH